MVVLPSERQPLMIFRSSVRASVRTVNQLTRRLPVRLVRTLASVAAVAVVTGAIELLKSHVPVLSLGVLYIFAVLPVAILWGLAYAIPVSIGSMAAFNFLFLP